MDLFMFFIGDSPTLGVPGRKLIRVWIGILALGLHPSSAFYQLASGREKDLMTSRAKERF